VTAVSIDFIVDEETEKACVEDGSHVIIGGMITGKTVKTTRNNKLMAFITLEDLAGSVEVIIFPKDYERKRDLLVEESKVFIKGRASIGDDPVGKLICEQIVSFDSIPRELWLKFPDKDSYMAKEKEVLKDLKESEGNDSVVIYLEKERAKKVMPSNWNVHADKGLVELLYQKIGEKNVKVVEKNLKRLEK
jgi:DNA polymerase-3 subunit alpha